VTCSEARLGASDFSLPLRSSWPQWSRTIYGSSLHYNVLLDALSRSRSISTSRDAPLKVPLRAILMQAVLTPPLPVGPSQTVPTTFYLPVFDLVLSSLRSPCPQWITSPSRRTLTGKDTPGTRRQQSRPPGYAFIAIFRFQRGLGMLYGRYIHRHDSLGMPFRPLCASPPGPGLDNYSFSSCGIWLIVNSRSVSLLRVRLIAPVRRPGLLFVPIFSVFVSAFPLL